MAIFSRNQFKFEAKSKIFILKIHEAQFWENSKLTFSNVKENLQKDKFFNAFLEIDDRSKDTKWIQF